MKEGDKKDFRTYAREWHEMMVRIWTDRIEAMRIHRTGTLRESVAAQSFAAPADGFSMYAAYRFVEYGIYVDAGTGRGYTVGNGGNLEFLDPVIRAQKGKGKPRQRRPWFSVSWDISRRVLNRELTAAVGTEFSGMFDSLTNT